MHSGKQRARWGLFEVCPSADLCRCCCGPLCGVEVVGGRRRSCVTRRFPLFDIASTQTAVFFVLLYYVVAYDFQCCACILRNARCVPLLLRSRGDQKTLRSSLAHFRYFKRVLSTQLRFRPSPKVRTTPSLPCMLPVLGSPVCLRTFYCWTRFRSVHAFGKTLSLTLYPVLLYLLKWRLAWLQTDALHIATSEGPQCLWAAFFYKCCRGVYRKVSWVSLIDLARIIGPR